MKDDEKNNLNSESKQSTPEQNTTIRPAILENENDELRKNTMDLSAIIPKHNQQGAENTIILNSREKELKTDGSVVLGLLKNEDEIEIYSGVTIPEQIDIAKRKEELKKHKEKKQNKKVLNGTSKNKKAQTNTSIIALIVIAIIVGTILYIYYKPNETDFELLPIEVELGDKLPVGIKNYVKPGIGKNINEMSYKIDTSEVIVDQIGEYNFSVTHEGTTKTGIIKIIDTTPPSLTVRQNVTILETEEYTPETFILECIDYTGCNYSFEDKSTTTKYTKPGIYTFRVVAKDAYKNKTVKKVNLKIESSGMVKKYIKREQYNINEGYSKEYKYELHYTEFGDSAIILYGTYQEKMIFDNEEKFEIAYEKYNGEINYTIDKTNKIILYELEIDKVDDYANIISVHEFLINEGYSEE